MNWMDRIVFALIILSEGVVGVLSGGCIIPSWSNQYSSYVHRRGIRKLWKTKICSDDGEFDAKTTVTGVIGCKAKLRKRSAVKRTSKRVHPKVKRKCKAVRLYL